MLRLKTLGGLSIQRASSPPTGAATQRRRLALLALLARSGETGLSRDKLLGYLWPESEPEKARGVLAQALYALRRDLGAEELFLGTSDLRLNPAVITSDIAEFSAHRAAGRLEEAAAQYTGPFLDGIYINDAPEFERWVEAQRTELAHDYKAVLDRLAAQATAAGDHATAVAWWRKLAAADPLSARVAIGLMRALAAAGDSGGAVQHAKVYETLLRQELEAAPDPEVGRLADRLRTAPVAAPPSPKAAPEPAAAATSVLRGPDPDLAAQGTHAPAQARSAQHRRVPRRYLVPAAIAALAVAGLAGRALLPREASAGERKMIAVLPFENLGRPDDEYFADGLTEEVTSRLANIGGIGVISRTSAIQYKGTDKSLPEIARELGVAYVLEGTVRWDRNPDGTSRVRVTPQLIQVSDDSHLWADRFDAALADVFQVQSQIAEQVASALGVTLGERELLAIERRPTGNLEAYDQYLRGTVHLDRSWGDEANVRAALAAFEAAVRLDSTFALAQAKLSTAHSLMFRLGYDRDSSRLREGRAAAERALALDPVLPAGHVALGYHYYWGLRDLPKARECFLAAHRLQRNNADAVFGLGAVERRESRWDDAVAHLRESADLDPRSSDKAWNAALALLFRRDFATSERYLDRAIALAPDWAFPYGTKASLYLSWQGDVGRARQVLRGYPKDNLPELIVGLGHNDHLLYTDSTWRDRIMRLRVTDFPNAPAHYYRAKAKFYRLRKERAMERPYLDSMVAAAAVDARHGGDDAEVDLAMAYAWLGWRAEAIRSIERAKELLPPEADGAWGADRGIYFAQIYAEIGERDLAVAELERLLSIPSRVTPIWLRSDPIWDPLKSDDRFRKLAGM